MRGKFLIPVTKDGKRTAEWLEGESLSIMGSVITVRLDDGRTVGAALIPGQFEFYKKLPDIPAEKEEVLDKPKTEPVVVQENANPLTSPETLKPDEGKADKQKRKLKRRHKNG